MAYTSEVLRMKTSNSKQCFRLSHKITQYNHSHCSKKDCALLVCVCVCVRERERDISLCFYTTIA